MKKFKQIALIGVASVALLAFSLPAGDNPFEGVITFSMSFGSAGASSAQASSVTQGSSTKVYIKGDKMRTDVTNAMMHQTIISDKKTKEEITLVVTSAGDKYEVKPDPTKAKTADDKPEIKYLDSTKTIAGYKCKAALVTMTNKNGEKNSFTVFYTDELPYSEDMGKFKGLKGCPMQFGIKQMGMTITFAAQTVEKKSLSDTLFVVPTKGYKVVASREEMMKDMQQNMSGGQ